VRVKREYYHCVREIFVPIPGRVLASWPYKTRANIRFYGQEISVLFTLDFARVGAARLGKQAALAVLFTLDFARFGAERVALRE
jgi:hypothetical protein